jgi:hypothetical protein
LRKPIVAAGFLILCLSLWAGRVEARSVYINGVRVDGAVNLRLTSVDVEIDAQGDVRIAARNYKVNLAEEPGPLAPRPTPPRAFAARRYYAFTRTHGDAQWDIDLFINGSFVRRFSSRAMTAPVEITRLLHAGDNAVRVRAVKQEGDRTSMSGGDFLELVLGEGQGEAAGQMEIEKFYSYRRTAAEAGLFVNDATVTLR